MAACPDCGVVTLQSSRFCQSCGRHNNPMIQYEPNNAYQQQAEYAGPKAHTPPKAFDQIFGIEPRVAFLAFVVDIMLFGTEVATMGITLPILIPLAIVAGVFLRRIAVNAPAEGCGGDHDSGTIHTRG